MSDNIKLTDKAASPSHIVCHENNNNRDTAESYSNVSSDSYTYKNVTCAMNVLSYPA